MVSAKKFELNLEQASAICKKHGLDNPKSISRFSKGMINDVFSIDNKYVIKINTGSPEIKRFHKEYGLYRILADKKIPVPEVYAYDDTNDIIGYDYILMEYISGTTLSDIWNTLGEEEKNSMLIKLGKLLGSIHNIEFNNFGDEFLDGHFLGINNYQEYFNKNVKKILGLVKDGKTLSIEKIENIREYFNNKLFDIEVNGSLLHFNFNYDNIIVNKGKIKAVIDWEWSKSGHSEEELGIVIYRIIKNEAEKNEFLKGYRQSRNIDNDFGKRMYAYCLLYYLKVLPSVKLWNHKPEKQKEYYEETDKLFRRVINNEK